MFVDLFFEKKKKKDLKFIPIMEFFIVLLLFLNKIIDKVGFESQFALCNEHNVLNMWFNSIGSLIFKCICILIKIQVEPW